MTFNTHLHGNKCCNNYMKYTCHLMILFQGYNFGKEHNVVFC